MADGTKIEWTDATWNPITGCAVVSPGCTNCYAMLLAGTRLKNHPSRKGLTRQVNGKHVWTGEIRFNEQWLDQPLRWTRPRMIFVCAHGDLFAEGVTDNMLDHIFAVMALCPQHTFQVLTKRPERMREYLLSRNGMGNAALCKVINAIPPSLGNRKGALEMPLPNVWLGVSVEDQPRADQRIPILLDTPAAIRWISAEPLLGLTDLRAFLRDAWKIKQAIRLWDDFTWPSWVPKKVRADIESFWNPDWDRGPNAWMRSAIENGHPPAGTRGAFRTFNQTPIEGRFLHAWNNIGRVITDDGAVHGVSAGTYQSRPSRLDWVVVGGESGPCARPMHPDWARDMRDQCASVGVAFLFKQWGEWTDGQNVDRQSGMVETADYLNGGWYFSRESLTRTDGHIDDEPDVYRIGKKRTGRLLDGVLHDAYPEAR